MQPIAEIVHRSGAKDAERFENKIKNIFVKGRLFSVKRRERWKDS